MVMTGCETGKERDAETGLDYFGFRYMSAAQGRFTSPDPNSADASLYGPQSWNAYSGGVAGGAVGGGFELSRQFFANGFRLGAVEWGRVGTAAAGGAPSGAIAGGTLGIGAAAGVSVGVFEFAATNAAANVIGGVS